MVLLDLNNIAVDFSDDIIIRIGLELANGNMNNTQLLDLILEHSN